MNKYTISAEDIMLSQHYNDEDKPFIERSLLAAIAILITAGAYKPKNPLTRMVVELMVGHFLSNRDLLNQDYVKIPVSTFALEIGSLITTLQLAEDEDIDLGMLEVSHEKSKD